MIALERDCETELKKPRPIFYLIDWPKHKLEGIVEPVAQIEGLPGAQTLIARAVVRATAAEGQSMVSNQQDCAEGEHVWRAYTEDEVKELRSKARAGRPPMAWVENGEQCERCGRVEATVSWYGQLHRARFGPKTEGGPSVIHWPTRSSAPGGGMGMR